MFHVAHWTGLVSKLQSKTKISSIGWKLAELWFLYARRKSREMWQMHAILCELRGPEMTTHPPIFALLALGAINGDQDLEVQHSRRGKTFMISTPQVPFVVLFPAQTAPVVLQTVDTAPRYVTTQNIFGSTERPWSKLSIEPKKSYFPEVRDRFHSLELKKPKCQSTVRPWVNFRTSFDSWVKLAWSRNR